MINYGWMLIMWIDFLLRVLSSWQFISLIKFYFACFCFEESWLSENITIWETSCLPNFLLGSHMSNSCHAARILNLLGKSDWSLKHCDSQTISYHESMIDGFVDMISLATNYGVKKAYTFCYLWHYNRMYQVFQFQVTWAMHNSSS